MNLYIEFGKNLVLYGLRSQILVIYFFFLTPGYFVFLLLVIFGMHCNVHDSFLHIFSHIVVRFTLWSTFFLSILLNFFWKKSTVFYWRTFFTKVFS